MNSFTPKRIDVASFLKLSKDKECEGKEYKCEFHEGNFIFAKLDETTNMYVDKCHPNYDLPIIKYFLISICLEILG